MFYPDIKTYIKGYDICLVSKVVQQKPYNNFQFSPIFIYCWTNLSISFVINLAISMDWTRNSYDVFFVIIDCFIKIVHHKPIMSTIHMASLAKIIIDMIIKYQGLPESIINAWDLIFTSKFSFCYAIFLTLSKSCSLYFICRQMVQLEDRIV